MIRWFRRHDPDDEWEEDDAHPPLPRHIDFGEEPEAPQPELREAAEVPEFALVVSANSSNGWHVAAVVSTGTGPAFYVRAITVRWPFSVARPTPSNRVSSKRIDPVSLSPTGSTPARKLVVNWGWMATADAASQLRFYIKRETSRWVKDAARATIRLTLKESGWPHRRIVVPVTGNRITWNPPASEAPAAPAEPST